MTRNKLKYLRELFHWRSGTIQIRANGEVVRERIRFTIGPRGEWLAIPVR